MAAPFDKPLKTSKLGLLNKPIYARTNVLCNGQIAWKVGSAQDMEFSKTDPQRADLRPIIDVTDDLNALNSLQIERTRPLTPLEVKQPLRHVQSALPNAVRDRIYTGDLYGSKGGVFSCPDGEYKAKAKQVFQNDVRVDGDMNYNDFFRRLRRSEWLLWDVEVEKGYWVAVIAHLYKGRRRNPNKKFFPNDDTIPTTVPSPDFNRVDEWCVVATQRSPKGDAMVNRVKQRLPKVLKYGKISFDKGSEIGPAIWIPTDESNWSSGIRVYALIKKLMHRITEFYCRKRRHQKAFWSPLPGWLNLDEVRAEMQGRVAQRCIASTGYRSRIAIEGVRRWIGVKELVRADELRPRRSDYEAYLTGELGADGRCIPVGPCWLDENDSDDNGKPPGGPPGGGGNGDGSDNDNDPPSNKKGKQLVTTKSTLSTQETKSQINFAGPLPPPPTDVYGWNIDSEDSGIFVHRLPSEIANRQKKEPINFTGPLPPPPTYVYGWDSSDDSGIFIHHLPPSKSKMQNPGASVPISKKQATSHEKKEGNKKKVNFAGPLDPPLTPPSSETHGLKSDSSSDTDGFKGALPVKLRKLLTTKTSSELQLRKLATENMRRRKELKRKARELALAAALDSDIEEAGGIEGAVKKRLNALKLKKSHRTHQAAVA